MLQLLSVALFAILFDNLGARLWLQWIQNWSKAYASNFVSLKSTKYFIKSLRTDHHIDQFVRKDRRKTIACLDFLNILRSWACYWIIVPNIFLSLSNSCSRLKYLCHLEIIFFLLPSQKLEAFFGSIFNFIQNLHEHRFNFLSIDAIADRHRTKTRATEHSIIATSCHRHIDSWNWRSSRSDSASSYYHWFTPRSSSETVWWHVVHRYYPSGNLTAFAIGSRTRGSRVILSIMCNVGARADV